MGVFKGEEKQVTEALVDEIAGNVRVGIHEDAQVVFKRGPNPNVMEVLPSPPQIDQVLSASANWRYLGAPPSKRSVTALTRALLRASYDGAYLAAILRSRKLLLLTLIGGASFGNPMEMILEEIRRAHDRWATHPRSKLQEVRLVLYDCGVASMMRSRLEKNNNCVY